MQYRASNGGGGGDRKNRVCWRRSYGSRKLFSNLAVKYSAVDVDENGLCREGVDDQEERMKDWRMK